ncbi:hypothetical protein LCI18_009452 [Fusarium solani-melongenae]|uniref:Uncharacterized protein n=1 Tax=Fusarium solani subsp. cucurbitae TaxID=2747967 RepID=A0ACD3ZBK0_FUSSC|nr:hypothetical protein LCI18_009452 [Fusarium solani-melongenae]
MYTGRHPSSSSFESLYRPPRTDEYIRLGKTSLHGISSSRAAGLEQQQWDDFKPGKRLNGIGENTIAILLWVLFAAATTASWILLYTLQPNEAAEYGFKTIASDTCKHFKLRTNTTGMYLFALNIATTAVAFVASYFRDGLLAPSPGAYQESKGRLYLGIESVRGFRQASWPRKVMYVVLLLASLPLYYLSNSLVSTKYSAYNAYEVLVSTTFFEGRPFDLAGINMTRYDSLNETPTMPSSDLQWPTEYGASDALNSSLARLQREPTLWKNLSRAECVKQYNDAVYTRYRTLVLVTDYDSDSDSNSNNSNSALAATVLPGYRLRSASSSLIALCPDSYLEAYNGTIHPPETPFLTLDKVIAAPKNVTFLSPTQAREWATNRSLSADVSPTRTLERRHWTPQTYPTDTFDPMPGRDLCYHYWSDNDRWMPNTLIYRVPQCPLQYCLAEPVKTPRMCQVVYSPRVLFILSVFLTFLFTVISIALCLRCTQEGLYSREDASEYFRHKKCRPRWSEKFYGKYGGGSRPFHHRRMPWHLFFFSTVVFTYVFVLWGVGGIGGYYPSGPGDETWFFKALVFNKALHIVFEVQFYFEDVDVRKRFFRVTPDMDYQDAGKKNWVQKQLRKIGEFFKSRETYLKLFLAVRSFLIHTVYEFVFISQLMGTAPLEEAAGTLTGSKPLAFTTLGVPGFNERSVDLVAGFIFFNWLVFVGLPSVLLDVIFYATAGRPVDEKEHAMAPSTMLLSIVWLVTGTYWDPSSGWVHMYKCCRRSKYYP